jgi:hypothetical protein
MKRFLGRYKNISYQISSAEVVNGLLYVRSTDIDLGGDLHLTLFVKGISIKDQLWIRCDAGQAEMILDAMLDGRSPIGDVDAKLFSL